MVAGSEHDNKDEVAEKAVSIAGVEKHVDDKPDRNSNAQQRAGWRKRGENFNASKIIEASMRTRHTNSNPEVHIISHSSAIPELCGHDNAATTHILTLLTQVGVKRGLKLFGKAGDAAVESEIR